MAKRIPIVGGNWKSNPERREDAEKLIAVFNEMEPGAVETVIFPSALHIQMARSNLKETIAVGAQNTSKTKCGAFTGELSAEMIKDIGCQWTLIGHSERRHIFGETVEDTVIKVERTFEAGVGVIFCIGELLEEREAGKTVEVCEQQLGPVLPKVTDWSKFVIAYEPVWAIGTGVVATKDQAQEAHEAVREFVREKCGDAAADAVRMQYGGSVTPENCAGLIGQPDIDGFLVGGASLKPTFTNIVETVASS